MKNPVFYRTIEIDGFSIFYRESGSERAPTLLLLHGLPSSSRMYRGAISATDVASLDGCWDRTPSRDMTTNTTVHEVRRCTTSRYRPRSSPGRGRR